jgi:formate hydrogenlyase subunit 6/NADH:ubiquinone oxidoreductase subunit I
VALPEILNGMKVVIRNVFRRKETVSYPEVRRRPFPRYRGRHILDRHPDGLEKCIGCGLCVEACPTEALLMTTEYELSGPSREGLIYTKEQLIVDTPIQRHWPTKRVVPPGAAFEKLQDFEKAQNGPGTR